MTLAQGTLLMLVGIVFGAGAAYGLIKGEISQIKADVRRENEAALLQRNNIGDKVRQVELKLIYTAMMVTPEEKRQEVLNALVRRLT